MVVAKCFEGEGEFGTVQRPEPVQWFNYASVALALRTGEAVLRLICAHPLYGRESLEQQRNDTIVIAQPS